ncbi:MAG: SRPBCC family protein [Woeseiaceae bacterium]
MRSSCFNARWSWIRGNDNGEGDLMGRCYNSALIDAPIDEVWTALRNFHDVSWAPDVVTKIEVVGARKADQIGARRILNDAFHETLLSLDDRGRTLSYSIDVGPGPVSKEAVSNYVGRVSARPVTEDGSTFVEWESTYDSANDASVGEFCNPIYQALLRALKAHFG